MTPLLELHDIKLQRGDFRLEAKQLRLLSGQLYALKGSNGAGKSTLLQVLALLQPVESGNLYFLGQRVDHKATELKKLRQQITLLEQNPLLFSGSVEKNLAYGLKLRGIKGKERQLRIEQALETTGLKGFNQRPCVELSGGEARRVAMARALVLQPKLLLLDEPTANLDVTQVASLERFLVELPKQGLTVVIATHDQQQPERLGGKIIRMENGQLLQNGPQPGRQDYQPLLHQVKGTT